MPYLAIDKVKVEVRVLEQCHWGKVLGRLCGKAPKLHIQHGDVALCSVVAGFPDEVAQGQPRSQVLLNACPVPALIRVLIFRVAQVAM